MTKTAEIEDLLGKKILKVSKSTDNKVVEIYCSGGKMYRFFHSQDCCEHVALEDGYEDLEHLVNDGPVLLAEQTCNKGDAPEGADSHTWTFYKLSTNSNSCTLRWLGQSNGYHGEGVDIDEETHDMPDPSDPTNRFLHL